MYNVNFKIVMIERKIERASGLRSHAETKELGATIEVLTSQLESVNSERFMLMNQLKKAENYLTQAKRQNQKQISHQGRFSFSLDENSF